MVTCERCGWTGTTSERFCPECGVYFWESGFEPVAPPEQETPAGSRRRRRVQVEPRRRTKEPVEPVVKPGSRPIRYTIVRDPQRPWRVVPEHDAAAGDVSPSTKRQSARDGRHGLEAVVEPARLEVEPGQAAVFRVQVRNTGSVIEAVDINVHGVPPEWLRFDPPRVNLDVDEQTGAKRGVSITVRPPREPSTLKGSYPLKVLVWASGAPNAHCVLQCDLTVVGYKDADALISPAEAHARRQAVYALTVTNRGNVSLAGAVRTGDANKHVRVSAEPTNVGISPGGTAKVKIRARATRRIWWAEPVQHPVVVTTHLSGGHGVHSEASFTQVPILPRWSKPVAIAALALSALMFGFIGRNVIVNRPRAIPTVTGLPLQEAERLAKDKGFRVQRVEKAVPFGDTAAGKVVAQHPGVGERQRPKTTLVMTVAAPPRPFETPDVRRSLAQDATKLLAEKGVAVDIIERRTDPTLDAGMVIDQQPAPGSPVSAGDVVKLTVSAGKPKVVVPSLVNLSRAEAIAVLGQSKLRLGVVQNAVDDRNVDRVIGQDPPASREVAEGSDVNVVVGVAPPG